MHTTSTEQRNPLLDLTPPFPFDEVSPDHVIPAIRTLLAESEARFDVLEREAEPTWRGVIEPLERLGERLQLAWAVASHFLLVKNSPELRTAVEAVQPLYVRHVLRLRQSRPIYECLEALRQGAAWETLDGAQRRILEVMLRHARHAGVALPDAERARFAEIQEELARLGTRFGNHVLDATNAFALTLTKPEEVAGLPETVRGLAAQAARERGHTEATPQDGPWVILLSEPFWGPFLTYGEHRGLRETIYRAHVTRASRDPHDNQHVVREILKLRREAARLLGYPSFAALSVAAKMAPSVAAVEEKMDELREVAFERAHREFDALTRFAGEETDGAVQNLLNWDLRYWVERLQEKELGFREEDLRPYFPFAHVLDGLFELCHRLFGIRVVARDGEAPVWHEDVRFFQVADEGGRPLASFYMDAFIRPHEKQGGAWQVGFVRRQRRGPRDQDVRLPVSIFVCNQRPAVGDQPSLMSFTEVRTLFHEFGHALHNMLTVVDYAQAAGTASVEWDAVEIPSMFMENWCYDPGTLRKLSKHVETGEPLPEALIEKVCASRRFRSASGLLRQLFYSLVDLDLHQTPEAEADPEAVVRAVSERATVVARIPEDRFLCAFSHIFAGGYAAGYYSYLWAHILSADVFAAFEEVGLENAAGVESLGRKFRDTFLAAGGSQHPMDVFRAFRSREPRTSALLHELGLAAG